MREIRFFHTADLHLGSPFSGMRGLQKDQWKKLKDSTLDAFDRLIDYAVEEQPDFLLIAGDIYDGEDRSIRSQHRFQQGMQRLFDADIPVVLSHGNHDHLSGKWTRFELPENVHVFGESVSQFHLATRNGDVVITGFSYGQRHVKEPMIDYYPPAEEKEAVYIGMLHGSMEGETSHAVYAPFAKQQLLSKNYDYWALGHIHVRQELHMDPPIVYPGNLQGRHRNENGKKGFYDVRISGGTSQLSFIPSSVIQFDTINIDCSGLMHMNELLEACVSEARKFAERFGPGIVELKFSNMDQEATEMLKETSGEELMDTIRESFGLLDEFVWAQAVSFNDTLADAELTPLGEEIMQAMESWQLHDWKDVLKDLYRHPKGSRFLEPLNSSATAEIRAAAAQKIRLGMHMEE
ncbi:metallophosphoesterase family protein [Planococcus shenhongbingii]|uniref:DNA repair exonuclease n=1 Tax=Planococcus shenhongbingii TaxID=3058398 RepID=A0ABT8NHG6_9BACL|nr:DNA repair exonuclease [Planococcus sp. N017]MDN7247337.1 DNA repair exonuclease [Planococcus sp. N017]